MIDSVFVRENPEVVKEAIKEKMYTKIRLVDEFIFLEDKKRQLQDEMEAGKEEMSTNDILIKDIDKRLTELLEMIQELVKDADFQKLAARKEAYDSRSSLYKATAELKEYCFDDDDNDDDDNDDDVDEYNPTDYADLP